ncbi:MAG: hypothetical protein IIX49_03095 [Oscillospiraceae bacterium]|nr:hypothetical protein [Oscillospiraceae bacterium]
MNFDVEKAKRLINIFGNLNADNQEALLVEASRLEINQGLKDQVVKSGKPVTEENLGKATDRFIKVMNPLMDHWDDMGPNNHAALAILLNEMTKGELTKEEYIDFVFSSRQLSISEYIEKYIPGADIEEAKKIYQSFKKAM